MKPLAAPSRRALLAGLGSLAAARLLGRAGAQDLPAARRPNLLVILSDEHNAGLMGNAGAAWMQTPHLDRLASEGVRLSRAYAAAPLCAPARASLWTGLAPPEHNQTGNQFQLDPATPTLATLLGASGYRTACVGKTHSHQPESNFGFQQMLDMDSRAFQDEVRARLGAEEAAPEPSPADAALFNSLSDRRLRGAPLDLPDVPRAQTILEHAQAFLRAEHADPFLLWVSFTEPHHPWNVPAPFYDRYDPADVPLPPLDPKLAPLPARISHQNGWDRMSEAQRRLCLARYAGSISYMDDLVGRLLATLAEAGRDQDTLVLYTSDHGDMAGEHGMWLKSVMYEGAVRVPMIFRLPGVLPAGAVHEGLFGGADLLPSLATLLGATEGLEAMRLSGRDASAVIRGEGAGPELVFSMLRPGPVTARAPGLFMARDARWKLVLTRTDRRKPPEAQLYDLDEDPGEMRDLSGERSAEAEIRRLESEGERWLDRLRWATTPGEKASSPEEESEE